MNQSIFDSVTLITNLNYAGDCRSYSKLRALQFLSPTDVAILELNVSTENEEVKLSVVDERHYQLTGKDGISPYEVLAYNRNE